jgi:hypothetical protein
MLLPGSALRRRRLRAGPHGGGRTGDMHLFSWRVEARMRVHLLPTAATWPMAGVIRRGLDPLGRGLERYDGGNHGV